MATYILWDISSDLFTLGPFTLRWNALLVLLAYVAGRGLLAHIFQKEGKSAKHLAIATAYLLILALATARLLYVIIVEPQLLWTDFFEVVLPFDFSPSFQVADSFGLSIHGAALGALLGAWLFYRKTPDQHKFYSVLDDVAIIAASTAFFLFAGSFMNSEAIGQPTASSLGTAYLQPVKEGLRKIPCCIMRNPNGENPLELVVAKKDTTVPQTDSTHQGVILYLFFKPGVTEQSVNEFLIGDVKTFLFDMSRYVYEPGTEPLHYSIIVAKDGKYIGRIQTRAVTRFPVHLLQALASLIIFMVVFRLWRQQRHRAGVAFASFMVSFWTIHLLLGFLSEERSAAELTLDAFFVVVAILATLPLFAPVKKTSPAKTTKR